MLHPLEDVPSNFLVQKVEDQMSDMGHLIHDITPKTKPPGINAEDWKSALRLAPLRRVQWTRDTNRLFQRVADGSDSHTLRGELRAMGEVMVAEGKTRLEMAPSDNMHRAMLHRVARDMGLQSESEGQGDDRHVVVSNLKN